MNPAEKDKPFTSTERYFQLVEEYEEMRKPPSASYRVGKWVIISIMAMGVYFLIQDFRATATPRAKEFTRSAGEYQQILKDIKETIPKGD